MLLPSQNQLFSVAYLSDFCLDEGVLALQVTSGGFKNIAVLLARNLSARTNLMKTDEGSKTTSPAIF